MATYTSKYNLKKPDEFDFADIADLNGNMDSIDTVLADKVDIAYCNCETTAGVPEKIATLAVGTFSLQIGVTADVKFTNANTTSAPALNVNGTGAKTIKQYGTNSPNAYAWQAGAVIRFIYDGVNWVAHGLPGEKGDVGPAGADGISCTHSWSGTTLTITSASGTSSANLKGEKGDKGDAGATPAVYVTMQGTSGIWDFRAWSDNTVELWGRKPCTGVYCVKPWGNVFESDSKYSEDYAFMFETVPKQIISLSGSDNNQFMLEYPGSADSNSKTSTGGWYFVRPSTMSGDVGKTVYTDIFVRGVLQQYLLKNAEFSTGSGAASLESDASDKNMYDNKYWVRCDIDGAKYEFSLTQTVNIITTPWDGYGTAGFSYALSGAYSGYTLYVYHGAGNSSNLSAAVYSPALGVFLQDKICRLNVIMIP